MGKCCCSKTLTHLLTPQGSVREYSLFEYHSSIAMSGKSPMAIQKTRLPIGASSYVAAAVESSFSGGSLNCIGLTIDEFKAAIESVPNIDVKATSLYRLAFGFYEHVGTSMPSRPKLVIVVSIPSFIIRSGLSRRCSVLVLPTSGSLNESITRK